MPTIWAEIDKPVKKGQQILGFYGAEYWEAISAQQFLRKRGNEFQRAFKKIIGEIEFPDVIDLGELSLDG